MTTEHMASRTLVKSPPELWAECSEAGSLARHIGEFGEIRITRLEPEKAIAWEAEYLVGTVEIEPSGWGTKVTLTAQAKADAVGDDEVAATAEVEDAGASGVQEEPVAISEGATESAPDPPATQSDPVEEEADAKVEEEVAEPDPAVAAEPVPAGGRWKRLIARSRAWFGSSSKSEEPSPQEDEPSGVDAESPSAAAIEAPSAVADEAPSAVADEPPSAVADEAPSAVNVEPPSESDVGTPSGVDAGPAQLSTPPPAEPDLPPELDPTSSVDADAILAAALDSLGQAHHRPFSRA